MMIKGRDGGGVELHSHSWPIVHAPRPLRVGEHYLCTHLPLYLRGSVPQHCQTHPT